MSSLPPSHPLPSAWWARSFCWAPFLSEPVAVSWPNASWSRDPGKRLRFVHPGSVLPLGGSCLSPVHCCVPITCDSVDASRSSPTLYVPVPGKQWESPDKVGNVWRTYVIFRNSIFLQALLVGLWVCLIFIMENFTQEHICMFNR